MSCCDPPVETIPKGSWECRDCHARFGAEIASTKKEETKKLGTYLCLSFSLSVEV